jgi:hypothetical protein
VGWRERDYARFNDDERRRLYGNRGSLPPSAEVRQADFSGDRNLPLRSDKPSARTSIWFTKVDHPLLVLAASAALWLFVNWLGVSGGPLDYLHH